MIAAVLSAVHDLPTWRLVGAAVALGLFGGALSLRGER